MRQEKVQNFDCLVKDGSGPTILIFHGYGADANDLAPLADVIDPEGSYRWVFPNAPLEVPIGPGIMGRAWFPIDMAELEKAMASGSYREMSEHRPQHLDVMRGRAVELINTLVDEADELIMGGFSQGAMLSLEVALHLEKPPKALVLWSGTLLNLAVWKEKVSNLKGVPVFQSHGSSDPLLDPKAAQRLSDLLRSAGCKNQFVGFQGGHEIPMPIIQQTTAFLKKNG